jgi:hypothetical protein
MTTDDAGTPPSPAYGTIKPGTYYLTQETFYPGAAAHVATSVGGTLKVTVVGQVATLSSVLSDGTRYTFTITMATPATGAPTAEEITCTNKPALTGAAGTSIIAALQYTATATTLTTYVLPYHLLSVYTFQS